MIVARVNVPRRELDVSLRKMHKKDRCVRAGEKIADNEKISANGGIIGAGKIQES